MKHLGTVMLETERLILRKTLEIDYVPMFKNWANDESKTQKCHNDCPYIS